MQIALPLWVLWIVHQQLQALQRTVLLSSDKARAHLPLVRILMMSFLIHRWRRPKDVFNMNLVVGEKPLLVTLKCRRRSYGGIWAQCIRGSLSPVFQHGLIV